MTTAEMIERYRAGESCAMIGAAAGLGHSAVQKRLKAAGFRLRPARLATLIAREEGRAWTSKFMTFGTGALRRAGTP